MSKNTIKDEVAPVNNNEIIKALCVKQPYASFILDGFKTFEIRSWKLPNELIGQDILLCASASPKALKVPDDGDHKGYKLPSGCALAVIRFSGCTAFTKEMEEASFSGWVPDQYAWEVSDVFFIKPFPIKGKLKFFDVDISLVEGSEEHPMTFVDHATGELL